MQSSYVFARLYSTIYCYSRLKKKEEKNIAKNAYIYGLSSDKYGIQTEKQVKITHLRFKISIHCSAHCVQDKALHVIANT